MVTKSTKREHGFAPASLADTRTDPRSLRGRKAISYFRWSSPPQEQGDTERRQEQTLRFVAKHFGLVVDQKLTERAKSGSKAHNRLRGELGDLLKACAKGLVPRGTPLIVESFSRLSREGTLDVFGSILKPLIADAGLIIVDGRLRIWDVAAINSHDVHALVAEIIAAREYAADLSFYAQSAHQGRRERLQQQDIVRGEDWTEGPLTNSPPPAWIIREATGKHRIARYRLHPEYVVIVRQIFALCIAAHSVVQIAKYLIDRKVPKMAFGKRTVDTQWRGPRIGVLLRSETVCGWYQPHKRIGNKRVPVGDRVRLYPAAIDDATWFTVRDILDGRRRGLRGRRGKAVANLFKGKVFCKSCNGPMRVVTWFSRNRKTEQGLPKWRRFICASNRENGECEDHDQYDLNQWEPRLLHLLSTSSDVHRPRDDGEKLRQQIGKLRSEVADRDRSITALRPRIGSSATRMRDYDLLTDERDALLKQITKLEIKQAAEAVPHDRHADLKSFLTNMMLPALQGDVDVRERLRSLISRLDFQVVSHQDGCLRFVYGDYHMLLHPVPENHVLVYHMPADGSDPVVVATPYVRREGVTDEDIKRLIKKKPIA